MARSASGGRVRVGTSGWLYPRWRGDFYPTGLRQADELGYLARRLPSVEVNGTFYSLTRPATCAAWRRSTPPDFVFAIKGSRYITHLLKLANSEHAVANFFASGILRLGSQLGPILWQLPPQLPFDRERAQRFFSALPRDVAGAERWARRHDARTTGRSALRAPDGRQATLRHAVEVRHPSFACAEFVDLARHYGVAIITGVDSDFPVIADLTADFAYVRIMGTTETEEKGYSEQALDEWAYRARTLAEGQVPGDLETCGAKQPPQPRDVYLYVISGYKTLNPAAAMALIERL